MFMYSGPSSVIASIHSGAFDYYFGSVSIPDVSSIDDMLRLILDPEYLKGVAQLHYTAPVFGALSYSLGLWLSPFINFRIPTPPSLRNDEESAEDETTTTEGNVL
jgi:hypothetical protein